MASAPKFYAIEKLSTGCEITHSFGSKRQRDDYVGRNVAARRATNATHKRVKEIQRIMQATA